MRYNIRKIKFLIFKRSKELKETLSAARRCRVIMAQHGPEVFFIDPQLFKRSLAKCFDLPWIGFSKWFTRDDGPRNKAFEGFIRSRFHGDESGGVWEFEDIAIGLPGRSANERNVIVPDLREICMENHYANHFPFGRLVKDGDVVLDCGANIGAFSLWAARQGPHVRVHAFEPEPSNFATLQRNVRRNGLQSQIVCHPFGLAESNSKLPLSGNGMFTMYRMTQPDMAEHAPADADSVQCVSIDEFVHSEKLDRCDVIKMDIEGFERNALRGAVHTLATRKPRLSLAAYHLPSDPYVMPLIIQKACSQYNIFILENYHLYAFC